MSRTHTYFERSGNVSSKRSILFNLHKDHTNYLPHPRPFSLTHANKNTPLYHTTQTPFRHSSTPCKSNTNPTMSIGTPAHLSHPPHLPIYVYSLQPLQQELPSWSVQPTAVQIPTGKRIKMGERLYAYHGRMNWVVAWLLLLMDDLDRNLPMRSRRKDKMLIWIVNGHVFAIPPGYAVHEESLGPWWCVYRRSVKVSGRYVVRFSWGSWAFF